VAFSSTVAAKILGDTGNYFCQQAMRLSLRFSDLTQRPKPHTGFWLSDTRQYGFKCEVFIMKAGVPRWYPRTSRAALRGVVVAPCLRTAPYGTKSIKGKRFTIRDRREPKLPRRSHLRTKSCLEQIHGASYLPPRSCEDHPQEPWVLPRSSWGARQRSSR
jgi:hypothetical protein